MWECVFCMVRRDPCQQGDMHPYTWDTTNISTDTHTRATPRPLPIRHGVEPLMQSCECDQTEHRNEWSAAGERASSLLTSLQAVRVHGNQVVSESVVHRWLFPLMGMWKNIMVQNGQHRYSLIKANVGWEWKKSSDVSLTLLWNKWMWCWKFGSLHHYMCSIGSNCMVCDVSHVSIAWWTQCNSVQQTVTALSLYMIQICLKQTGESTQLDITMDVKMYVFLIEMLAVALDKDCIVPQTSSLHS